MTTITASAASDRPLWARRQRELFTAAAAAARRMSETYTEADGRLRFAGVLGTPPSDRDGVDDFYESFASWGQFYLLGGDAGVLRDAKRHWEGITRQLTEFGMLRDEYERAYDWFHQGESFEMFGFLCMADPDDASFARRARRFSQLYTDPANGNFDARTGFIRAPHTGSAGAARGLTDGEPYFPWSPAFIHYGLPLEWVGVPDVETAYRDPAAARLLGRQMWDRMARGDTAVNLAVTSLVLNAFLMGQDDAASWVRRYTDHWAESATENGVLADNVGLDGTVGQYLSGRWYGGHYGWSWPHGLHSVGTALMVAVQNRAVLDGPNPLLEVARSTLDQVISHRRIMLPSESDGSMAGRWTMKWDEPERPTVMVPYRHGDAGWHDYMPMQAALPVALWHLTGDPADLERLQFLEAASSYEWSRYFAFKDKEDAGHEEPWLAFLRGDSPDYPEAALGFAIEECERRSSLMTEADAAGVTDINHWQRRNPISTEALVQLTLGAPQTLYNGGLLQARVRYWDLREHRPGLPAGVGALVRSIQWDATRVELHNLSDTEVRLTVQAGALAEHRIDAVEIESGRSAVDARYIDIALPPETKVTVTLALTPRHYPPTYAAPWAGAELNAWNGDAPTAEHDGEVETR